MAPTADDPDRRGACGGLAKGNSESHQRLTQALQTNFGIWESWLEPGKEFVRNFEVATNATSQLVLMHKSKGVIDGLAVNGNKPSEATGSPFEQYVGSRQREPIVIGSAQAQSTVVVSNLIEAVSLMSVPELTLTIRTVVSGVTRLENVAARALDRPSPVVLIEYGSGRRCGRHRNCANYLSWAVGKPCENFAPATSVSVRPVLSALPSMCSKTPRLGPSPAMPWRSSSIPGKTGGHVFSLDGHPHLRHVRVAAPNLASYAELVGGVA